MSDQSIDPVRVEWTLLIGFVTANRKGTFTIDRDEWDEMTPERREAFVNEMYQDEINNYLDGGPTLLNADYSDPVKD